MRLTALATPGVRPILPRVKRAADGTSAELVLGIECGGTRTIALLADAHGRLCGRVEAGPANLRLMTDPQLAAHFAHFARRLAAPHALGIGMAGAREETERRRIRTAAAQAWPGVPCWAGNDLETALAAATFEDGKRQVTRLILISGTGSCCYGQNPAGQTAKVGGWGHLLGDQGSGYDLGLQALRLVIHQFDLTGYWPPLGARLLRALLLQEPNDLIDWLLQAPKADVAALAVEVFEALDAGDRLARQLVQEAAARLAHDAAACARRLTRAGAPVEFHLVGSLLLKQPRFAKRVASGIRRLWPTATVRPLEREGAWGAIALARREVGRSPRPTGAVAAPPPTSDQPILPEPLGLSPTEQRNPRSRDLDRRSVGSAIELMLAEDARIPDALLRERAGLERAVNLVVRTLKQGGRLFYVGAGTSGRLGVLDASECPPTFRTPPDLVQGIMAGGHTALWSSLEGAEDDYDAGARSLEFRGVSARDAVMGIAASGRTPFVWGALNEAKRRGATTLLLCFNPNLRIPRAVRPTLVLAPDVGPEILTGSTRLKAGTATKLVLNLLTTLAMVRLGKVVSNLMVDLNPSNAKLRDRAVRIVRELTGVSTDAAHAALERSAWVIQDALKRCRIFSRRRREKI